MLSAKRFAYDSNIRQASRYRDFLGRFWPVADRYSLCLLDLSSHAPPFGPDFFAGLADLRTAISAEWEQAKTHGGAGHAQFVQPQLLGDILRKIATCLQNPRDREALTVRAEALESGYSPKHLALLANLEENVTLICGQISTWYGKQTSGLPTAFACVRDPDHQAAVRKAMEATEKIPAYLARLHPDLCLGNPPAFAACSLFFMAGEGDLHPKHIAYFLPEDEGVKRSPFKKTYYFANTHRALIDNVSRPLFDQYISLGITFDPSAEHFKFVPTLGVLAHELGHFVHRPTGSFASLNAASRWTSVVLQEAAADVFGTLIFADIWATQFGLKPDDVIAYYLAECIRYIDRGLGYFPDSDGMFLQIAYFLRCGALRLETDRGPRLIGEPGVVLAALRSLARVLADLFLSGNAERSIAFHKLFGPDCLQPLGPLLEQLGRGEPKSVEYVQEHIRKVPELVGASSDHMA